MPNKGKMSRNKSNKQRIKFANQVLFKNGENLLKIPLKIQDPIFRQSFFVKILEQISPGSESLKETENLML